MARSDFGKLGTINELMGELDGPLKKLDFIMDTLKNPGDHSVLGWDKDTAERAEGVGLILEKALYEIIERKEKIQAMNDSQNGGRQ